MTDTKPPKLQTPELDRQSAIIHSHRAEVVQDFIDWCSEQGLHLAKYESRTFEEPCPGQGVMWEHNEHGEVRRNTLSPWQTCKRCHGTRTIEVEREGHWADPRRPEQLMADFFQIDLNKIEAERRAILEQIRAANDEG